MKIALAALAILTAGCTIEVKPIPKQKAQHSSHHAHHVKKVSPSPAPNIYTEVDSHWMERYRDMESDFSYHHRDDYKIESLPNGHYRVPHTVKDHYSDMARATDDGD